MNVRSINKLSIYIGVVFFIIVFYCGFKNFISISLISVNYNSFEVKGYSLVLIGSILHFYSIITDKRNFFFMSCIISIVGYLYTFYTLHNINLSLASEYKQYINYGIGFYMYILSFVILIINLIMFFVLKKSTTSNNELEELPNNKKINGDYLITNYIFGFNKRPDLYNKITIVVSEYNTKDLNILLYSNEIIQEKIKYDNIISINIKNGIIMNQKNKEVRSDELANQLLATAFLGVWGAVVGRSSFVNDLNNYDKIEYNEIYEIEIIYFKDGEKRKLMFNSKKNPKDFFDKYEEKLLIK